MVWSRIRSVSVRLLQMLELCLLWTQVDTVRTTQWNTVIDAIVELLQQQLALHPDTGLVADFLVYNQAEKRYQPSQGKILERDTDGDFGYNACR